MNNKESQINKKSSKAAGSRSASNGMKFFKYTIIILVFLVAPRVFAGNIYIEQTLPKSDSIRAGDEILLEIKLDSENTEYNAAQGELVVSSEFSIKEIITGNSFITVWLENPQDHQSSRVNFSGITPSGYNNQTGAVFSIILKSEKLGSGKVTIDNLTLFKHDGLGTPEPKQRLEKIMRVSELPKGAEPYLISISDTNKPTIANVELIREYDLYDGDWALVFLGSDKGSGIERFDVLEGRETFAGVTSPYRLDHQRLNKTISLVAIDADGNTETVPVDIPHKFCVGNSCYGFVEGILLAIILIWVILGLQKIKKLASKTNSYIESK